MNNVLAYGMDESELVLRTSGKITEVKKGGGGVNNTVLVLFLEPNSLKTSYQSLQSECFQTHQVVLLVVLVMIELK